MKSSEIYALHRKVETFLCLSRMREMLEGDALLTVTVGIGGLPPLMMPGREAVGMLRAREAELAAELEAAGVEIDQ